jgi:hypothetical protein
VVRHEYPASWMAFAEPKPPAGFLLPAGFLRNPNTTSRVAGFIHRRQGYASETDVEPRLLQFPRDGTKPISPEMVLRCTRCELRSGSNPKSVQ